MENFNNVPLEQLLVLAYAFDEEDPEAHVGKAVLAQFAALLPRYVGAVKDLERNVNKVK